MSLENSCQNLIDILKSGKTAVFCGAGISFNSGLPIVSSLLDYLFDKLELTENQKKNIHSSNLPFESIMEMTLNESGLDEIIDIFNAGIPNANHKFIAKLAKQGYINIIYTTNFDTLIEKALEQEGLLAGIRFKVYSSEAGLNSIMWNSDIIHVIKIHGCVTDKLEMAITMSLIATDRYSAVREKALHEIFGGDKCDNVLVLGYSCSDIDLSPIIESIEGKKAGIYFIEHQTQGSDDENPIRQEAVSLKPERNPFKNYQGLRVFSNTDELIASCWKNLLEDEYSYMQAPMTAWKNNIEQWYLNSVKESGDGVKHHISARLLYAVGEFREAIEHNRKGIEIAMNTGNQLAYAAEMGNMGMALSNLSDYGQARKLFEKSIPLCRQLKNLEALSAQLQAYANVLHHMRDDNRAIEVHKEALQYAELEKNEFTISNILGNMSNSYNRLGDFENASKSLEKALVLSRRLGNKQAESSQLGIIANTYLHLGRIQDSLESCLKGLEIKRNIGDRQGECQILSNLISVYMAIDMRKEAVQAAYDCLKIAKAIGNKQAEQIALVQLAIIGN
jgi:tetratricopeptide (TPR) repeat protein